MNYFDAAIAAAEQLDPGVRWAWKAAVHACWAVNRQFRVDQPVRRTAEFQHSLWQKGRNKPGKIVTYQDGYVRRSQHQDGMAIDLYPLNCTYQDIAEVMARFGITHPFARHNAARNNGFVDEPHFSFELVERRDEIPRPTKVQADANRRKLEREIKKETNPQKRKRLLERLNSPSIS